MKKLTAYLMAVLLGIVCLFFNPNSARAGTFECSADDFATNPANGHTYCLTSPGKWSQANEEAIAKGGNLVTVNDSAEQDWLLETFGSSRLWIGFTDEKNEGSFEWSSGETSSYTNWLPGEPNDGNCNGNEDYTVINGWGSDGGWNDLIDDGFWQDCSETSHFCRQENTPQSVPPVCQIGFQIVPGIVEIPSTPVAYNGSINGVKWNDLNGDGIRDSIIQGEKPDVVMVVDLSWSTILSEFQGSPVGDVNGDGAPNEILDAELAGFIALNQQLIDQGFGETAQVGIVLFSIKGHQVDMDPSTAGKQLVTNPAADKNGNGIPDVKELLSQIKIARNYPRGPYQAYVGQTPTSIGGCYIGRRCRQPAGGTNYEPGLQLAQNTFQAVQTPSGEANIIFLSDGVPGGGLEGSRNFQIYQTNYVDEVDSLKAIDANISAFGVGEGASLTPLQKIDPKATIFTTTNELLNVFSGLDSGSSSSTVAGGLEPGLSGVTVYLDLNNNGVLDSDEPTQVSDDRGLYHFTSLQPGSYIVREVLPSGFKQTTPKDGSIEVTLGADETVNNINFGNLKE
ncbi:MAG: lectin-like protein [Cyanobacteriota bacterium]|nr:lectin-like protein [Cyanobacteriota bacterium]